jgi:hypothetical protein
MTFEEEKIYCYMMYSIWYKTQNCLHRRQLYNIENHDDIIFNSYFYFK